MKTTRRSKTPEKSTLTITKPNPQPQHTSRERHMAQSFQDALDDLTIDPGGTAFDTKLTLVPPDLELKGTVVDCRMNTYKNDRGENADGLWKAIMALTFSINDPEVKEETNLDDPRVVYTIFFDVDKSWDGKGNPPLEQGKNKNVSLGQVLAAFGLNDGRKIKIPSMFMHEECWLRTGRPRSDADRFAPVMALGRDPENVRPPRRR